LLGLITVRLVRPKIERGVRVSAATGSTTAVSAAAGSVVACTSSSSGRPGGCLEFGLEAFEKPKELKEPHCFSPAILFFA
jgi:hypothetical protein